LVKVEGGPVSALGQEANAEASTDQSNGFDEGESSHAAECTADNIEQLMKELSELKNAQTTGVAPFEDVSERVVAFLEEAKNQDNTIKPKASRRDKELVVAKECILVAKNFIANQKTKLSDFEEAVKDKDVFQEFIKEQHTKLHEKHLQSARDWRELHRKYFYSHQKLMNQCDDYKTTIQLLEKATAEKIANLHLAYEAEVSMLQELCTNRDEVIAQLQEKSLEDYKNVDAYVAEKVLAFKRIFEENVKKWVIDRLIGETDSDEDPQLHSQISEMKELLLMTERENSTYKEENSQYKGELSQLKEAFEKINSRNEELEMRLELVEATNKALEYKISDQHAKEALIEYKNAECKSKIYKLKTKLKAYEKEKEQHAEILKSVDDDRHIERTISIEQELKENNKKIKEIIYDFQKESKCSGEGKVQKESESTDRKDVLSTKIVSFETALKGKSKNMVTTEKIDDDKYCPKRTKKKERSHVLDKPPSKTIHIFPNTVITDKCEGISTSEADVQMVSKYTEKSNEEGQIKLLEQKITLLERDLSVAHAKIFEYERTQGSGLPSLQSVSKPYGEFLDGVSLDVRQQEKTVNVETENTDSDSEGSKSLDDIDEESNLDSEFDHCLAMVKDSFSWIVVSSSEDENSDDEWGNESRIFFSDNLDLANLSEDHPEEMDSKEDVNESVPVTLLKRDKTEEKD